MPPARPNAAAHKITDPSRQAITRSGPLAALRQYNYRLFVASQVVANSGVWMQRIAQDWLVLSLTGSVTAVGITTALQFAPVVIFGLLGGVLADRHSKRALLLLTQSTAGVLAAVLAVLTLSGSIEVEHVYLIAFALGVVTAVDNPTRQSFVPELVGRLHLGTAVSLNSSVFQLGGLVGPAVGGVLIAHFGEGWAFVVNAVGCFGVVIMLCCVRTELLHRTPSATRAPGQLREGLRYVRRTSSIRWAIFLVGSVGVLALNMPVVLSAFADEVFGTGAAGFGTFNAMIAVGGVLGALAATRRRTVRLRTLVSCELVLGAALVTAAVTPSAMLFALTLVGVGVSTLLLLIGANVLVQLETDVALRGRVMALYVMVQLGGRAAGGPVVGWVSEVLGPRLALVLCGAIMTAVAVVAGLLLARSGSLRLALQVPRRHRGALTIVPRGSHPPGAASRVRGRREAGASVGRQGSNG